MIIKGRHAHHFFVYGGAHAFLLVAAFQIEGREGWLITLPLMAVVSFYAWFATMRRHRVVGDMPTSQIASAAQGYVELSGWAEHHPGSTIIAPLTKRDCCWFRYTIEEREDERNWRTVDEGESAGTFLMRDDSGSCTVDPEGAEILCEHEDCWTESNTRYTEWRIHDGDRLYALGDFRTRSFAPSVQDAREDLNQLLAQWKSDKPDLLRRFDLDKDGQIDDKEWELARAAAKREIARNHVELRSLPSIDFLMKPADGRVFLLANHTPDSLKRRFAWWSWGHLALLFGALIALVVVFF